MIAPGPFRSGQSGRRSSSSPATRCGRSPPRSGHLLLQRVPRLRAARSEPVIARRALPNSADVFRYTGMIDRREGHWDEATRNLERALELDRATFHSPATRFGLRLAASYQMNTDLRLGAGDHAGRAGNSHKSGTGCVGLAGGHQAFSDCSSQLVR